MCVCVCVCINANILIIMATRFAGVVRPSPQTAPISPIPYSINILRGTHTPCDWPVHFVHTADPIRRLCVCKMMAIHQRFSTPKPTRRDKRGKLRCIIANGGRMDRCDSQINFQISICTSEAVGDDDEASGSRNYERTGRISSIETDRQRRRPRPSTISGTVHFVGV